MDDDESIHNPHDRFVRRLLGELDRVRDLVRWQLPAEVLAELDLESIRPAKESFVDIALREGLSDLVFDVKLSRGDDAFVVLLFEHKSTADPQTIFQVLRYIVGINDQRLRSGQPLCCVIPLVFYHGRSPWNVARTMQELVESPEPLRGFVPSFAMPLLDLSQCSDEELRGESVFLAYMALLKYIKRDELPERLPEILELFRKLLPPATALQSFETILRYIATGTDRVSKSELIAVVTQVLQVEGTSIMPTIAEQWKQEGRQEGERAGVKKGEQKGELIGRILVMEEVLKKPPTPKERLAGQDLQQLQSQVDALSAEMQSRR
ncbi:Rpn family recombination-promoting nuclease/putative transposase [Rosistilla oblonga]|uniref:Rpn family recombination-promoting nuclease/putative transposase n=1 Tax=Rosistilla oblonga TaxID=2527990 RepID=UPI003A983EE0